MTIKKVNEELKWPMCIAGTFHDDHVPEENISAFVAEIHEETKDFFAELGVQLSETQWRRLAEWVGHKMDEVF